ncbi:MAG: hypothetical protein JOZ38_11680 [Candidatus Eremiobacteraeota bacterium]|nr:hypothetical protein [Candidatus Eremiobacteraeota bacterium]
MKFRRLGLPALFLSGALLGSGVTAAIAGQPHMYNALHDLQAAKAELEAAATDKAGHRVNAINYVNQAIGEVNMGIQAGRM